MRRWRNLFYFLAMLSKENMFYMMAMISRYGGLIQDGDFTIKSFYYDVTRTRSNVFDFMENCPRRVLDFCWTTMLVRCFVVSDVLQWNHKLVLENSCIMCMIEAKVVSHLLIHYSLHTESSFSVNEFDDFVRATCLIPTSKPITLLECHWCRVV